jgi:hypothetical protein
MYGMINLVGGVSTQTPMAHYVKIIIIIITPLRSTTQAMEEELHGHATATAG